MKLRGINPIERHAEKLFLGLIGLVFLGVLAMQFVGAGGMVSVGGASEVPLERAYEEMASEAERKLAQVNSDQVDERVPRTVEDVAARFQATLERGVAPREELVIWLGRPRVGDIGVSGEAPEALRVALPELPRPATPIAAAYAGTLNPLVVDDDLRTAAPHLPARQPYDLRFATIETEYDAGALVEALRSDPSGDARPIPEYWWRQSLEILAVELERREMPSSGSVAAGEPVPPWPEGPRLLGEAMAAEDRAALQDVIVRAQRARREVVRPLFYPLISGERWAPPSVARGDDAQQAQIERLLREKREALAELERLDQRAMHEALENVLAQVGRPGGRPRDQGSQRDGVDRERQREEALERRRSELEARIEEINDSLAELGVDPEGRPLGDPVQEVVSAPVPRPVDGGTIQLWGHDLSARPGGAYSYRVRVHVPNPLYGNGPNLAEDLRELASTPTLTSPWSEWSAPVRIEADSYLFVAGATRGGALGDETRKVVTAELYSFFYGYWRRHIARLTPGDAVTGRLDLSELSLPQFEVERSDDGSAYIAARSTMQGTRSLGAEGWYLLDIIPEPVSEAGAEPADLAVFQDPLGELVIRREREDRRSPLRDRLQRNAELGQRATVADPAEQNLQGGEPSERRRPREDRREREGQQDGRPAREGGGLGGPR